MTLKKTVESLAQGAVSTATTAVRHPLGTAARATDLATDLAKGAAGAGIGLVRSRIGGAPTQAPAPDREKLDAQPNDKSVVEEAAPVEETPAAEEAPAEEAPVAKEAAAAEESPAAKKAPVKKAPAAKKAPAKKAPAKKAPAAQKSASSGSAAKRTGESRSAAAEDPRDNIPGPDLAPYVPPAPDDLPEPIVIVADDAPTG